MKPMQIVCMSAVLAYAAVPTLAEDCNTNGLPDACDLSCGEPGGVCDLPGCGLSEDCNTNGIPDECEILFEASKLLPADAGPGDSAGCGVSIDHDYVIVGAKGHGSTGAAYVYHRDGLRWLPHGKLTASDGATDDDFGGSVGISGRYAVVGAPNADDPVAGIDSGAAYIFRRNGDHWDQQVTLTRTDARADDSFGEDAAIDGDAAIVSARLWDYLTPGGSLISGAGGVWVFRRDGELWAQEAMLVSPDPAQADSFGTSVAISGDRLVVGARYDDFNGLNNAGSAYVFRRVGTQWSFEAKLTASDAAGFDAFGMDVAIEGQTILVGAYQADPQGDASGAAYVYEYNGTIWVQQQKLTAADGAAGDWFGRSVAVAGDFAIIAAMGDENTAGSAYLFHRAGTLWTELDKQLASDGAGNDWMGFSASMDGPYAIVGALSHDGAGLNSGAAYVFGAFPIDANANQHADVCEVWADGDADDDGDVDLADYAWFVECLAGPDMTPAPARPITPQDCLDWFDFTADADVDLKDFAALQFAFDTP